ncbi:Uncharacterised protein [uncultured Clostridium sp.]|nr:Uncharacterised protein [uncultured Clostridium sp.]
MSFTLKLLIGLAIGCLLGHKEIKKILDSFKNN